MKSLVGLVAYCVFIQDVSAANTPNYKVFVEQVGTCKEIKNNMFDLSKLRIMRINRSSNAFGVRGEVRILRDMPDDMTTAVSFFVQDKNSKIWKNTLIETARQNACKWVKTDKHFYPVIQGGSELPTSCPIKKGIYKVPDVVWEFKDLPPFANYGCWKVVFTGRMKNDVIGCFHGVAKVAPMQDGPSPTCL